MNKNFQEITCKATGAKELYTISDIQSLWSGYGKIMRYGLMGRLITRVAGIPIYLT